MKLRTLAIGAAAALGMLAVPQIASAAWGTVTGASSLSLRSCAFSNAGDWAASRGAGAQLLPDTLRKPHPTRRAAP